MKKGKLILKVTFTTCGPDPEPTEKRVSSATLKSFIIYPEKRVSSATLKSFIIYPEKRVSATTLKSFII